VVAACSSEDTTAPAPNNPPTITYTFSKLAVGKNESAELSVVVDDRDDDPLTVTWAVTRNGAPSGTLQDPQGDTLMTWQAPNIVGRDTIRVSVSDGKGGVASVTETIQVGTVQTGDINVNRTWTKAESPILIRPPSDRIAVITGRTLTIGAGVDVLIDKPTVKLTFIVEGDLITNGTGAEPVMVVPNFRSTAVEPGFWTGFEVQLQNGSGTLNLTGTRITHAIHAIRTVTEKDGDLFLNGCSLHLCSGAAIAYGGTGTLRVENSEITSNRKSGIRIESAVTLPQQIVIKGNTISLNGALDGETVYGNLEAGISIIFHDPQGTIDPFEISDNEISRNDFPGVRLGNPDENMALYPKILKNNGIFFNEFTKDTQAPKINLRLEPLFDGVIPIIDASGNWWGAAYTDSLELKESIFDKWDDPSITVEVRVTPWLTEWPPTSQ
jgi:hypothetical protein